MIQDGIDYGEGFCKATEPGPDVECLGPFDIDWTKNTDYNTTKNNLYRTVYKTMQKAMNAGHRYRKPIKAKEKDMKEQMIKVNAHCTGTACDSVVHVSIKEIERLYAEAQRINAENEIKAGDPVICNIDNAIVRITKVEGEMCWFKRNASDVWISRHGLTKITNPAHIQSLNEIYTWMK